MTQMHMDPNQIRCSGLHPFMRLFEDPNAEKSTTNVSIWQVLYNPEAGTGHVLFLQSDALTNGDVRIYSDNEKLARWVQGEIQLDSTDTSLPVQAARFASEGDVGASLTVTVDSPADKLRFTWTDFMPAFASVHDPLPERMGGHGHYATYASARQAGATLNGVAGKGSPRPQPFGDWPGTSAFVVLGETWMRPA